MKILIVGDWHSNIHEKSVYTAFKELGEEPFKFEWFKYFKTSENTNYLNRLNLKFQNKYLLGFKIFHLNHDLVERVKELKPDLLFIYRGTHIYSKTLKSIRKVCPYIKIVGYNNDNPFSFYYPSWKWRHFLKAIPEYDLVFAYRKSNIPEYTAAGAKKVELLRSWYLPWVHKITMLTSEELKELSCDVTFLGHHEYDDRANFLELVCQSGASLKLYGPYDGYGNSGWKGKIEKLPYLSSKAPIKYVSGEEYTKAIAAAKIGLCFLSKLNIDTYTRRCFEIPAIGTALFSEYSNDLEGLFEEGEEAEFFRSSDELIEKITYYLDNPSLLKILSNNGHKKVQSEGHDVISRMKYLISKL